MMVLEEEIFLLLNISLEKEYSIIIYLLEVRVKLIWQDDEIEFEKTNEDDSYQTKSVSLCVQ